ncbi:MAG: LysE family transporter [Nitrososphaerota archaeon]|nr:LysE family transporter [Candidatus Geocrenenecus dongiae]
MNVLELFLFVVVVSLSGALSPGPLTFATIKYSFEYGGKTGLLVSLGHMLFELPLVFGIAVGLMSFMENNLVRFSIGVAGSLALILFGALELKRSTSMNADYSTFLDAAGGGGVSVRKNSVLGGRLIFLQPVLVGFIFTSLNPYFIVWWMSIGLALITSALSYALLLGVGLMYVFHVWLDYAWLGAISYIASTGRRFMKSKHIKVTSIILSAVMIFLGLYLLYSIIVEIRLW